MPFMRRIRFRFRFSEVFCLPLLFLFSCFFQSDILDGIKKDNYELTADMQKKLSAVCDEFTTSFTG